MSARSCFVFSAIAAIVLALAFVRVGHAQSTPAALTNDPLLAEVRGLRAELHQASGVSIRAQLLVARVQLQEQRIIALNGQLADVQRQLDAQEAAAVAPAEQVKRLEEAARGGSHTADQQRDIDGVLAAAKATLAQMERAIGQLRRRQSDLLNAVATEQNRWSEFNGRLDELERQLPPR